MLINSCFLSKNIIETEICIIGSGPAGLAIASEFVGTGTEVCILESGDLDFNPEVQELSDANTYGTPFLSPKVTRHRQFGGNSNVWCIKLGNSQLGVRYAPLDEIDFEQRDYVPYSGWPITRQDLDPFYVRAQALAQSGPFAYTSETWESAQARPLPLSQQLLETTMFQFGPKQAFFQRFKEKLSQDENITVCYNATVLEIEANDSAQKVTKVRVASSNNKQFWVTAKLFVLAQGGMENARLLLMSNQQQSQGLGNHKGIVGKYFMDHPLREEELIPNDPELFNRTALYDLRSVKQFPVMGKLTLSKAAMQREELLNMAIVLFPRPALRQWMAVQSCKNVFKFLARKEPIDNLTRNLGNIVKGLDYVAFAAYLAAAKKQSLLHGLGRGGWSELPRNQRRFKMYQIVMQTEQAPNPTNRVVLSREKDKFGCPKLELHWQWDDFSRQSVERAHKLLVEELSSQGIGQVSFLQQQCQPQLEGPMGVAHHMGTTRMHLNPTQGVVNENCQVHGIANLFIAGSSVFPTGGYANPTLTILALSLRLADFIKQNRYGLS